MSSLTLHHDNRSALTAELQEEKWIVACLCAAWCDVCKKYEHDFAALSTRHPDKHFIWIDIEDHADLVGDFEVENFPTLLIQFKKAVTFFGTIQPDATLTNRLVEMQTQKQAGELEEYISNSAERVRWQNECNLWRKLNEEK